MRAPRQSPVRLLVWRARPPRELTGPGGRLWAAERGCRRGRSGRSWLGARTRGPWS
jgi:hypothetical protein